MTGAKRRTQLIHELGKRGGGMVTMCIGDRMGAAGIFVQIQLEYRSGNFETKERFLPMFPTTVFVIGNKSGLVSEGP